MCRIGTSGEGMPQNRRHGREGGRAVELYATLWGAGWRAGFGALFGAVLLGLVVGLDPSAALAADDGAEQASVWSKFMQTMGLKKAPDADSNISYSERSPLVVPPTRDLPPPAAGPPQAADWPRDPNVKQPKKAKSRVANDPSAPPVQANPNPKVTPKTWYNPVTWFSKEEYAPFTGEPSRVELTDPPSGYRTPSPEQPYGIGPDKKATATAKDFNLTSVTPPAGSSSSGGK
jgi:hypothetical protein